MGSRRLRLFVAAVWIVAAACGSTAPTAPPASSAAPLPTPAPSAVASPAPTVTASPAPATPSPAPPSPTASGQSSDDPTPSDIDNHAAPDLEALLPAKIDEIDLVRESSTGDQVLADDATGDSLRSFLASTGRTAKDLQVAQAYDGSGQFDLVVLAFRAPGMDPKLLATALVASAQANNPTIIIATATVGGHSVITAADPQTGVGSYLYRHGDVVYDVETQDENLASVVLESLP